ncbi:MAG: hypothetical protein IAE97_07895 [Chthoniobacterales bacterium]|nr:hypothetical protein [Chthoniobacterales bacterium]
MNNIAAVGTVTGTGSRWQIGSDLPVGDMQGRGELQIASGGVVSCWEVSIGKQSGSEGFVTVNGNGSMLQNSVNLFVGDSGRGSLLITNGGVASNPIGHIGRNSYSEGLVTVGGVNSKWQSPTLYVGTGGKGELRVTGGGVVSNSWGIIGFNSTNAEGLVTVSGTGSQWLNSQTLSVGDRGKGELRIAGGGTVKVGPTGAGALILASDSTSPRGILSIGGALGQAALPAGTLQAGSITCGTGIGAKLVNFNHTETNHIFSVRLSGSLEVRQNSGTTILAGTNTHTGNTVISNGSLAIAEGGTLTFLIGGNGTNNAVLGTGSFQASGSFTFNLSTASTNAGHQWTIVAPSIAASFGTNFTVAGFHGTNGNWTNSTNGVEYVFKQSTRVLSVQPMNSYNAWGNYWRNLHPGFTNTAKTADPDGDGFSGDLEFSFDGNPAVGTTALLAAVKSGTNAVFTWAQRKNPPGGATYAVKETSNPAAGPWTNSLVTISNSANQSGLNIPADYERKEFRVPAASGRFFRVQATLAP